MQTLQLVAETSSDDILERDYTLGSFTVTVWSPASAEGRAPLVLMGHGGGRHRKAPPMVGRARLLTRHGGFHVATIDAPGHGDRPRSEVDEREIAAMDDAMATGRPVGPIVERYNGFLAEQAVPEWRATLDALQGLPDIGDEGPVGYWGINLGTAIGVPLLVAEPRITAAVLGQFWYGSLAEAARQVTVPVEFDLQWDDEHIPRDEALALFDAFGSTEKTLHANAGRHKDLPRFEAESAVQFFVRHLRPPAGPAAT